MKVGDLIRQISFNPLRDNDDVGIITRIVPFGFYVFFSNGLYRIHRNDAELISESR